MSIDNRLNPSGGCYIATMVYGNYDHPQVMVLRDFRDSYLAKDTGENNSSKSIINIHRNLLRNLPGIRK